MTPEQLKASILQYAIQGKLVEQRPEEGTGEELYQQMQTDKQTLIREKKIKKEKPLPDIIDNEIPFDVPESWKWVKVGNVGSWSSGATPSRTNPAYYGGSIPWLKTGDLNDGFIQEVPEYITDLALEKTSLRLNPIGSVLMAMYGATIGKLGILEIPVTTNQACCACIPYAGMNNKYLFYYLMSMRQSYIGMAEGGAQPNISKEKIVNSLIPLPPAEEQRRIVAKIEELLPYVDRYAAAYEKLEQFNAKFPEDMKKSILQYAIQGKLVEQRPEEGTGKELYRQIQTEKQRLIKTGKLKKTRALPTITGEDVPYDFPASWKVCYIDDIAFVTKLAGFEYTKYISDNLVPTGIPLFKGKNVQNGKLVLSFESYIPESVSDELPRSQITKKCLLTPYVGTIGNIAVFDGSFKAHLGSNVGKIELLNSDTQTFILEEYVLWYLKSTYGYAELTKYKKATAQESISIDAIRNVVIAIPPLEEQRRIVAKLEEILPLCERLK